MTTLSPIMPIYRRCDIEIIGGEGVYLLDRQGRRYLDFAAGIAVNALGHCHPHLVAALKEQAQTLWHCSNMYQTPWLQRAAKRMVDASFADMVFFCSSGVEAVECGLKIIRRYHNNNDNIRQKPRRYRVITVEGGFHGRSFAAISASGHKRATAGYEPLMDGFDHVPFHDIDAMGEAINDETAAILLETIQGEGGIRRHRAEYLRAVRKLADDNDLLLFIDEVQCGMGRSGTLFAFEQAGITPDICSVAKGLGSGFPVGACLTTARAASAMIPGSHGSTYGNNPLALAVVNAGLDIMLRDGFMEHVRHIGNLLREELEKLAQQFPQFIEEVRGTGLMLGIKTRINAGEIMEELRKNLLLTAAAGDDVLRLLPPLIIEEEHVITATNIIRDTFEGWKL